MYSLKGNCERCHFVVTNVAINHCLSQIQGFFLQLKVNKYQTKE